MSCHSICCWSLWYISCHICWTSSIQNWLFSKLTQKLCQCLIVKPRFFQQALPSCQLSMPRKFILMTPPAKAFGFLRKAIMFLPADKWHTTHPSPPPKKKTTKSSQDIWVNAILYIMHYILDLELIYHFSASSTSKKECKLQLLVIP